MLEDKDVHPSQKLVETLTSIARDLDYFKSGVHPRISGIFARYSDRIEDKDGHEYRPDRQADKATVIVYERTVPHLTRLFKMMKIESNKVSSGLKSLDGKEPQYAPHSDLYLALFEVDLKQEDISSKIKAAAVVAEHWHLTML